MTSSLAAPDGDLRCLYAGADLHVRPRDRNGRYPLSASQQSVYGFRPLFHQPVTYREPLDGGRLPATVGDVGLGQGGLDASAPRWDSEEPACVAWAGSPKTERPWSLVSPRGPRTVPTPANAGMRSIPCPCPQLTSPHRPQAIGVSPKWPILLRRPQVCQGVRGSFGAASEGQERREAGRIRGVSGLPWVTSWERPPVRFVQSESSQVHELPDHASQKGGPWPASPLKRRARRAGYLCPFPFPFPVLGPSPCVAPYTRSLFLRAWNPWTPA
jgi:hypothetical protein